MTKQSTTRVCLDPQVIALLARDGIGWGHDMDCGCFHHTTDRRPNILTRLLRRLKGA